MPLTVNTAQAAELLVDCLKTHLVPMLTGSPGIGKSDLVRSIAEEYSLKVIDLRLSQCDPTDLLGFPQVDKETGKATYAPMGTFPLATDPLPQGKNGWLLFLDELSSAPLSVQAAAYKVTLDRMVGQHKLHDNCVIMCAGNLETDKAIVNRMSTALQSRMVHLELHVDPEAWLDWAHRNDIDYRVTAFINFRPDLLHKFSPDHNDKTFPCPRTWEFTSRLVKNQGELAAHKLPLLAGTISEGVAREFMGFCRIFRELPTIAQIINDPQGIKVPDEPSTLYALAGAVGNNAKSSNLEKLVAFINRLPTEFQVVTVRNIVRKDKSLAAQPALRAWIMSNARDLFD